MSFLRKKEEKSGSGHEDSNSFLRETAYNSDIEEGVRNQIEKRFSSSSTNKKYTFPRLTSKTKRQSTGSTCKAKTFKKNKKEMKSYIGGSAEKKQGHRRVISTKLARMNTKRLKVSSANLIETLNHLAKLIMKHSSSKKPLKITIG